MYKSGAEMYLQTAFFTFDKKNNQVLLKKRSLAVFSVYKNTVYCAIQTQCHLTSDVTVLIHVL